ncbi:hypothetical protein LUX34_26760 [Streptomyces werraensis]|nr:hypothetical protein [Streptomyces werraensis]
MPAGRPIGTQADPDVTVSDAGDFVVAWKEAFVDGLDDVWARGFDFDGSTTGRLPALRMNVVSGGGQGGPAVTLAPNGPAVPDVLRRLRRERVQRDAAAGRLRQQVGARAPRTPPSDGPDRFPRSGPSARGRKIGGRTA